MAAPDWRRRCKNFWLNDRSNLARWKVSRHYLECLEGDRLARERAFFLPLFCPMACDGEVKAGRGAYGFLVAEPWWFAVVAQLRALLPAGFGLHFRLRLHLDS